MSSNNEQYNKAEDDNGTRVIQIREAGSQENPENEAEVQVGQTNTAFAEEGSGDQLKDQDVQNIAEVRIETATSSKEVTASGDQPEKCACADNSTSGESKDAVAKGKGKILEPIWWCTFICTRPKLAFALTLGGHVMMILVTGLLVGAGYDLFPMSMNQLPLDIRDDVDFLRYLAARESAENVEVMARKGGQYSAVQPQQSQIADVLEFYFEELSAEANMLAKSNMVIMKRIEEEFWNNTIYQGSFCQRNTDTHACKKPASLIRLFDGTYSSLSPVFYDPGFDNVEAVIRLANQHPVVKPVMYGFLGADVVINQSTIFTSIVRCRIYMGFPLAGYANSKDRTSVQNDKIKEFTSEHFQVKAAEYAKKGVGIVQVTYSSLTLMMDMIQRLVTKDMSLTMGSMVFIVFFLIMATGSLWISGWAVFSILTGFLCTNLIYRVILDMRYFGVFHVLAIFILLCVGADDVFIFYDTWKLSFHKKYPSLAHRLTYVYKKASIAMMFTSLTTAIAFAISAASPILAIQTFGLYSALLIAVNYISVIVFFPCVVVTYHIYFEKFKCCCCCPANPDSSVNPQGHSANDDSTDSNMKETMDMIKVRKRYLVNFLSETYFKIITNNIGRVIIFLCFGCLLCFSIFYCTKVEINQDQVKFLKDGTNFGRYFMKRNRFKVSGAGSLVWVQLVFGLKEQDLSMCHKTAYECYGQTVLDNKFDLNSESTQTAFRSICNEIAGFSQSKRNELHILNDIVTGGVDMDCFLNDMQLFYQKEKNYTVPGMSYPSDLEFTNPYTRIHTDALIKARPDIYNSQLMQIPGFQNNIEVLISYWLYDGFRSNPPSTQFEDYDDSLLEFKSSPYMMTKTIPAANGQRSWTYTYGTKIKVVTINIATSLFHNIGFEKGIPVREKWEKFMQDKSSSLPEGMRGGFQIATSFYGESLWHWLKQQKLLVKSAMTGVAIGLAVSLPLLIIATDNIITGVLAFFSIFFSIISVIAVIPLGGWKLGLIESLNLTLVVGLSVDYVVHLAEAFSRSKEVSREGKLKDALEQVGISVLCGACTTMGGSAFMLPANILLFSQFGIFMFVTISFSLLYALVFYTTVLGVLGPSGTSGKLNLARLWNVFTCKRS